MLPLFSSENPDFSIAEHNAHNINNDNQTHVHIFAKLLC